MLGGNGTGLYEKTAALLSVNARVVPLLWRELWKGYNPEFAVAIYCGLAGS